MKKAKDYADEYNACQTEQERRNAISRIFKEMASDMQYLIKARKAKNREAVKSCIMEVNQKWNAFARRVEGVKVDGFLSLIRKEIPITEIYLTERQKMEL